MTRKALGRGIEALIPEYPGEDKGRTFMEIEISQLRMNPYQPRGTFDQDRLRELAESIRERGVIQPVVVRKAEDGYQLVVGERRLKAAQLAGQRRVPALLIEVNSPAEMLELALVENLQREDLNPIEEAKAYQQLMTDCGLNQAEIARKVGKERSTVANALRLLKLPERIQVNLAQRQITEGQARPLLTLEDEEEQIKLAEEIIRDGVTARRVEELIRGKTGKKPRVRRGGRGLPSEFVALEEKLRELFGTGVRIKQRGQRGKIEIEYYSTQDLERILEILKLTL